MFTPVAALDVNARYTLSVSNVSDLAGNLATNQPILANFVTLDTIGPTVAILRIGDNKAPISGSTVPIEALLATNETGASVRFTADFNPVGTAGVTPYRVNFMLPVTGGVTFRAIASDRFGNDGPFAELTVTVISNQPPTVALVRTNPPSGPVANGQPFSLLLSASDGIAVTNLSVVGVGAMTFVTNFASGALRTLNLVVPLDVPPGTAGFRAQATDALGVKSAEAILDIPIVDGRAPVLAILSPANNSILNPPQPLTLLVTSTDNSTNYLIEAVLSGALTSTQTVAVAVAPNSTVTNTFTFSLSGAPTNGAALTATLRAVDQAANSASASRTFRLPDTRPPQLASVDPTNGAVRQSLWRSHAFDFDEPIDPASVTTNRVTVTNDAGVPTPFSVSLGNGNQRLLVSSPSPLVPGATYTNTLLPGLTDTSSNPWRNVGGTTVPSEGVAYVFTTRIGGPTDCRLRAKWR